MKPSQARRALLAQLHDATFCRLAPSAVDGVGVFAVRDIPKGTMPFASPFRRQYPIVELTKSEIDALPPSSRALVDAFFLPDTANGAVAAVDPAVVDISFYVNDAQCTERANVRWIACQDGCGFDDIVATRDIACGQELLIHYAQADASDTIE